MFIYIKCGVSSLDCDCVIERCGDAEDGWYEISFKDFPKRRRLQRAIRFCDRSRRLPIVCNTELPQKKIVNPLLDTARFDAVLTANAFSFVTRGQNDALLIDRRGIFYHIAAAPLISVRTLYVFTENQKLYGEWNEGALRRVGSSAVLLPTLPRFSDFPAVLRLDGGEGDGHPFLFGIGGYTPFGNDVTVRGETLSRPLCGARYLCFDDRYFASALPAALQRGENEPLTLTALKNRLDRHLRYGL